MKRYYLCLAALAAAFTLAGCSSDDLASSTNTNNSQAIGFDSYLGRSAIGGQSRGSVNTVATIATSGFGVYAYQSTKTYDNTGSDNKEFSPNLMSNVQVTGTTDQGTTTWSYTPVRYWPVSDYVSFLAYAPQSSSYTLVNASSQESGDRIYLKGFEVNAAIKSQTDLLWNYNDVKNKTLTSMTTSGSVGKVEMKFGHALSRIGFKISPKAEYASTTFTITSVTLSGKQSDTEATKTGAFYKSGILNLAASKTSTTDLWASQSTSDVLAFTYNSSDSTATDNKTLANNIMKGKSSCTNNTDSYLFVIPQDFSSSGLYVTLTYTVQTDNGAVVSNTVSGQVKKKFEAGKYYTINITIGQNPIEFDVTSVDDWAAGDTEPSTDISL